MSAFPFELQPFRRQALKMLRNRAFTLVEILTVCGIMSILMGLLFTAVSRAKEVKSETVCLNNLHQIGIALQAYATDNGDRLPQTFNPPHNMIWRGDLGGVGAGLLYPYLKTLDVFYCPGASGLKRNSEWADNWGKSGGGDLGAWCSYVYRDGETGLLDAYAGRALMMDANKCQNGEEVNVNHKEKAVNILWGDGHVKKYPNDDLSLSIPDHDFEEWAAANCELFERADQKGP
ncbi:MAG: type II secretion system protein [Verrucomicrobiae bacterium]|nr:type II secretion system protein [Verrucomicrobiae bacterium]